MTVIGVDDIATEDPEVYDFPKLVDELNGGKHPHQGMPVANGHPSFTPRQPAAHDIPLSLVDRTHDTSEVAEKDVSGDEPIGGRVSC